MGTSGIMKGSQMSTPRQTGKRNPRCALMAAAFAFVALSITPLGDGAVFGQCQYEITHSIIQGPPCWPSGNPAPIIPRDMNSMGHVVGLVSDCLNPSISYGFLWIDGVMTVFDLPQGVTEAHHLAINDDGVITGVHLFPGEGYTGFAYDPHTQTYHYLMPLHDGAVATTRSSANSVNNQGIIAGMRLYTEPGVTPARYNAVIWRPFEDGSPVEDLGIPDGMPNSTARAINEAANAVGTVGSPIPQQGWICDDGKVQLFGTIPNGTTSGAFGINASRTVACAGLLEPNDQGFITQGALWRDSQWEILPHLPGANSAGPLSINDVDQTVGSIGFPNGTEVAVLWQRGAVYDMNSLATGSFIRARVINNRGQILTRYANSRAALLTPINVPAGDLNYDCRVDFHDLLIMFKQWGQVPQDAPKGRGPHGVPSADLNGDGVVNVTDLLILFDNWTN
jgi:uncharacterized membrane protein